MNIKKPFSYLLFMHDIFKDTIFVIGLAFLFTACARIMMGVSESYRYEDFDLFFIIAAPIAFVAVFFTACLDRAAKLAMEEMKDAERGQMKGE